MVPRICTSACTSLFLAFFTDPLNKALDENIPYQTSKHFKSKICQSKFSIRKDLSKQDHSSMLDDSVNCISENEELLAAHRTVTSCKVSFDTKTKDIDLNKVPTIQKDGDELVINEHMELNDLMEDCQNRQSNKQASGKKLGNKNSVLYQGKMAPRTRNSKAQSTRQQFIIQQQLVRSSSISS